jgi:hypothetical protein
MNIIKINNESFRLPHEPEKLNSVLNHLDMVKKGLKNHIKLFDMEGQERTFYTEHLNLSKIETLL